jgi:hypothetical protein
MPRATVTSGRFRLAYYSPTLQPVPIVPVVQPLRFVQAVGMQRLSLSERVIGGVICIGFCACSITWSHAITFKDTGANVIAESVQLVAGRTA